MGTVQVVLYFAVLVALVRPLGAYMARVYEGEATRMMRVLGPVERSIYRVLCVDPAEEMDWKRYAVALLSFNLVGCVVLYLLQRVQGALPGNPQHLGAVSPDLAFNTAISFVTNTNWQAYSGESTLTYATQCLGLTVQNFVSAATGMAALVALVRGLMRQQTTLIGNFWVDLVRGTLYILLPLSIVVALFLVSQGVVQTFAPYEVAHVVHPTKSSEGADVTTQVLALGPAASQIAIKQLGTNGGGFFGANSAHPFENPTPLSNFIEMLALLLIPAALCYTYGKLVKDTRQGWALLAVMLIVLVPLTFFCVAQESHATALDATARELGLSGLANLEGKELRFGATNSALWAAATTAASNGSVNAMHDSFTPLGGLVPMWLMQLGEVIFGGVGSGLYGMLMFVIVAVFVAGLMVGRTPEYLGKKVEAFEMKMASVVILVPACVVLAGTAVASVTEAGTKGLGNPGAHGFSEILYAFSSAANNNGSAFAGLAVATPFYNVLLAIAMMLGRYFILVAVLAVAGSLARKKRVPASSGTLETHTPLFATMLTFVVLVVGALTYVPALALGPVVEHLHSLSGGVR